MSEETKIEWCDYTFNPWEGCTKVSDGCKNCYAEARNKRFSAGANWGKGKPRRRTSPATWRKPLKWNEWPFICGRCGRGWSCAGRCLETMEHDPCGGELRRQRAFPSLCDWLDGEVQIEWFTDFLYLVFKTPNIDWLLLTKRIENCLDHLAKALKYAFFNASKYMDKPGFMDWLDEWCQGKPPCNVWLGVSVENQEMADKRIPELLKIPARVRFLSCEPLLGPLDLAFDEIEQDSPDEKPIRKLTESGCLIDWVIVGGESGPGARPCNIQWIQSIKGQCRLANVPCFVKQMGAASIEELLAGGLYRLAFKHKKGGDPSEWPESLRVREFPVLARSHVV